MFITSLLVFASFGYFIDLLHARDWMTASPRQVFGDGEYWRLWTTLFVHADLEHLLSNTLLFLPLVYLLTAYFGLWLFPVVGFFIGGLTNWLVLKTLPLSATLVGVSGVVYWMGAAWFTLYYLIDHRKNPKARFANILFLTLMLFVPETYKPQVSYLSHFIGFGFGVISAYTYYYINQAAFRRAEVIETIYEDNEIVPEEPFDDVRWN